MSSALPREAPPARKFLIVGDPIAQARSPELYNARFHADGINATLQPLRIDPTEFEAVMSNLKNSVDVAGLLVTIPFKSDAAKLVDELGPSGRRVGAINAIRRMADGRWIGDMFDGHGLIQAMISAKMAPRAKTILLLGAGGAGSAIADALANAGASSIKIHDVDLPRSMRLVHQIRTSHPACVVHAAEPTLEGVDVLINATPIGMGEDEQLPVDLATLRPPLQVVDIIPHPEMTPLLIKAARARCDILNGRSMIEHQIDLILKFLGLA